MLPFGLFKGVKQPKIWPFLKQLGKKFLHIFHQFSFFYFQCLNFFTFIPFFSRLRLTKIGLWTYLDLATLQRRDLGCKSLKRYSFFDLNKILLYQNLFPIIHHDLNFVTNQKNFFKRITWISENVLIQHLNV